MNTNPLDTVNGRERAWWYVRPELLALFALLFLACVLIWFATRDYLAAAQALSVVADGLRLLTIAGDATTRFILNSPLLS